MSTRPFVHLHNHYEYSSLDGLGTVTTRKRSMGYVPRAKALGFPAIAMTDHGVMSGVPEFYHECRKADIEPIIGEEFYFVPSIEEYKAAKKDGQRYHVVILAKGWEGYKVLVELSTAAHRNFSLYKTGKPVLERADIEALGDAAQHLVVLSGCAGSIISRAITDDRVDEAIEHTIWWREQGWGGFYIELQHHDTDFDRKLNLGLLDIARRYSIPWVVTNDPHYVMEEDECYHDALLAIQTASDIDDPTRFRFDGTGYHLRSRDEMYRAFRQYGRDVWKPAAAETLRIARACHTRIPAWESRTWAIPRFHAPNGMDSFEYMRKLAWRGLRRRGLKGKVHINARGEEVSYNDRLREELATFKEAGIADFMLVTRWCIEQALARGIRVGPGRGSVCGSLVAMCLDIHKIDPVKYDLLFARFLNPARPRMPDIDTDFAKSRRDEMFTIVEEMFGEQNVVRVGAYDHMRTKSAFKSLAKAYGISFQDADRLSKEITEDDESGVTLPKEVTEQHPELHDRVVRLSGIKRGVSTHAAGVLIADPDLNIKALVPQMWIAGSARWVGQYDLEAAEESGLLKEDFLGLTNLDTIEECLRIIKETTGEDFDPDEWDPDNEPDDEKVYELLAKGRTAGVFQMEGPTNTRGIVEIQPTCFEDIVSCTSLYRTGAISAGFPAIFNRNRREGTIEYIHPKLEPILRHTWGVVLYQEQVMDIGSEIAGFTMIQVDDIKEAIKHKKSTLMEEMKPLFIKGARKHSGIGKSTAEKIWNMIEGYAGYGYNRSHAVAYSFTTYQTARLKALWPLQYMTALLRTADSTSKEGKAKRDVYRREALRYRARFLPPCVNESDALPTFVPGRGSRPGSIRFGLRDLKGIGPTGAKKLLAKRPEGGFRTPEEVKEAIGNVRAFEVLCSSGALECLGVEGNIDRLEELLEWRFRDPMRRYREQFENDVILPEDLDGEDEWVQIVGEIMEIKKATTKNGKPYATWTIRWSPTESYHVRMWSECSKHWSLPVGSIVMVEGRWESTWQNVSVGNPGNIQVVRRAR